MKAEHTLCHAENCQNMAAFLFRMHIKITTFVCLQDQKCIVLVPLCKDHAVITEISQNDNGWECDISKMTKETEITI